MTEELRNPDLKDSARRKLMRGAFAAPAVLTLHSGSAIAAKSATCLVKANVTPTTVGPVPDATTDGYFRYRLYVLRNDEGKPKSYWIKGDDLSGFLRDGQQPFVPGGMWRQFDQDTNLLVVPTKTTSNPLKDITWSLRQDGMYVGLRVDASGAVVSAGASGSGSMCSGSCWNSVFINTL